MFEKARTYLDCAAGVSGNPSSPHEEGRAAKKVLEDARLRIARLLEVQKDDVLFTSGATEANALAILGHVRALRSEAGADTPGRNNIHVLYLPSAHASIVENMKVLAEEGVAVEALPIRDSRVDIEALKKMLRNETALVSMDAICGETGVVWNTREVAQVLKGSTATAKKGSAPQEYSHFSKPEYEQEKLVARAARPIQHPFFTMPMLHIDASQAPTSEKITRAHFGANFMTLDASKVGKARGIGALIAHRTIPLVPLHRGGGQERGLRPGSETPELAREFAAALGAAANSHEAFRIQAEADRKQLIDTVLSSISNVRVNEGKIQAPHIVNISLIGRDTDYLVALLNEAGFAVSTRSACETDSEEGSRAVLALTNDRERAISTLRISWGNETRSNDLKRFANALVRAVAFIDNTGLR